MEATVVNTNPFQTPKILIDPQLLQGRNNKNEQRLETETIHGQIGAAPTLQLMSKMSTQGDGGVEDAGPRMGFILLAPAKLLSWKIICRWVYDSKPARWKSGKDNFRLKTNLPC